LEREGSGDSFSFSEILEQLTGFVRRQYPIFIFVVACCVALGSVYLLTTPARYTSHAMLLIDSSKLRVLQQQHTPVADIPIDTAHVETQVEILRSENIGLSVVKELKLADDPEFIGGRWGLISGILEYFAPRDQQSETALTRKALSAFLDRRAVSRVGRTYVLDIGFTSLDAARSAAISNAIADAYIVDQLEAKYQATRRASAWLQDRIKELRQQASEADRAVLDYKEKNKIVDIGRINASGTRLLGEQQLEELNTQLGSARANAEEAKARLERINEVMKKEVPDATVTDSLRNDVITRLRNNYLDMSAKEAIWSARYGANHLAAVNLRTQMNELRRSIVDELGRIAQGYKSDFEIARSRVDGLERSLANLVASSQVINRDRLGLRDLESTAQVYHNIYDNFLQRYMEAIQQQSFPITEARVISAAAAPQRKSSPLAIPVLGLAGIIGIILSFVVAILREAVDRVFRTSRQIESTLQASCIAVLPLLNAPSLSGKSSIALRSHDEGDLNDGVLLAKNRSIVGIAPVAPRLDQQVEKISLSNVALLSQSELGRNSSRRGNEIVAGRRLISSKRAIMRQVLDEPLSAFAEAFRSIKIAADIAGSHKNNKVIGVTSTLPKEGKSTVSSNLAELIAHAGNRIILLDGDLRNPSLTRSLAPDSKVGLLEVLSDQVALNDAIYVDEQTGLNFLPVVVESRLAHTNEILASVRFKSLIDSLRKSYDYILIDFPPLAPVVDVRATSQVVDSYIYVVEWGRTRSNLVQHQLESAPEIHDRLLGVVLNKADVRVLERYEVYYGKSYYKNHYSGQYPYSG
jgi:succinoglycan biosynthesis transport protein ExoP